MKKHNISFIVLLLLVSLTIRCNKAETLMESEPGNQQVLIITRVDDENSEEELEYRSYDDSDLYSYSYLYMEHNHIAYSDNSITRLLTNSNTSKLGITNFLTETNDTLHTYHCEVVEVGGIGFRERHCNAPGTYCAGWFRHNDMGVCMKDWEYDYREYCLDEDSRLSGLLGPTEVKILGSEIIQDVHTTINMPEPNTFISPQAGAEINLNQDLVVTLKKPIGIIRQARTVRFDADIGFATSNRNRIYDDWLEPISIYKIRTEVDTSSQVIIPSNVLHEFYDSYPDMDFYFIFVKSCHFHFSEIPLYDKNGNLADVIQPTFFDRQYIQVSFIE